MQTPDPMKIPQAIVSSLTGSLSRALSNASDSEWKVSTAAETAGPAPDPSSAVAFILRFSGSWSGEATLSFAPSDISGLTLKTPAGKDLLNPEDALGAAIKDLCSLLAGVLDEHGPMSIQTERALAPDKASGLPLELTLQAGVRSLSAYLYCDSNLIASAQATSSKAFTFPEATAANLDLVLDVALNVTLRFGQRQLALREVLDLTSGSVVELDRQVDEPVELVLDGRVIARGEAVIIDGSYGMRITQVVQPIIA